jgi:hypothetical protein
MSKMGLHNPFGHLKHKLWPKEGLGVKLATWLRPLKVKNWPDFLACRWHATYHWKDLGKGYNFSLDLISIGGLHTKLWDPKVVGIPTLATWMWASWKGTEYTIRGKVLASPKSGPWWVLWVRVCPWLILAPKVLQQCSNQLVVWFCVGPCEWIIAYHSS